MMKMTLYAYYGMLGHEKAAVYAPHKIKYEIFDEVTVDLPYYAGLNQCDQPLVELDGELFPLDLVLVTAKDGSPALDWISSDGKRRYIKLNVVKDD